MRLEGKVALITGAGSGIGQATALMFGREGAAVIVNDVNEKAAAATAQELAPLAARVLVIPADVSSTSETQNMVARALAEFKHIDVLVNNAGVGDYRPFTEITDEAWDHVMAINLKGAFNCTRAVIEDMINQRSGSVINISSVAGTTGTPYHVHYSASKAGLIGLTKSLAKEIAQYGVRINAVAPALTETPLGRRAKGYYSKVMPNLAANNPPLGGTVQPEDIAAACTYLASDEARYVTGQVISPNGGSWI